MTEQLPLSFAGLLRQLERGINRTAHKNTGELLADALDLAGLTRELFVAAARGRSPAEDVLAAREGRTPGTGHRAARQAPACPYRGLLPFRESAAEVFYGRERLGEWWTTSRRIYP